MSKCIVCGNLTINGDLTVTGNVYNVMSMKALIKKLEEGGFKNITELTNNQRTVDSLEVEDLIFINFNCDDQSELVVLGNCTTVNSITLE
jgi:predicted ATP-dependent serine protease|tara:strand:+ start:35 stop:304 length:270 start_codon:yes stop_codon:yes gene_type:complete